MALPLALDHLRDDRVRELTSYWLEKRGAGAVPRRRDIDPIDIPWALPFIWLCDYLPAERDFRYRLAGEAINEAHGSNIANRHLRDVISASIYPIIVRRYLRVVDGPAIGHSTGAVYLSINRPVAGERIVLPLSREGDKADMILGMTLYERGSVHPDHFSPNKLLQFNVTPLATL